MNIKNAKKTLTTKSKTINIAVRDGAAVARVAHNHQVVGSIPTHAQRPRHAAW